jgi:nitronate monooxygenase
VRIGTVGYAVMAWYETRAAKLLGVRYPIVQAPMASVSTPELVAAVSNAGALGSLGAARLMPDELREAIRAIRRLTDRPFNVNVFAWPPIGAVDQGAVSAVLAELEPERKRLGLPEPRPEVPDVDALLASQLDVIADERVPVFSFTFGLPDVSGIREAGSLVIGTATTVAEARLLEEAGVDLIVVQAWEAGGHRGTFLRSIDEVKVGAVALVPQVVDAVSVPVFAAGGIMDGRGVAAALALGADGAWLGTAFVAAAESAAPLPYRELLPEVAADDTMVTPVFSGRHARAVRTELIERLERLGQLAPFPVQHSLTGPVHQAALERGDTALMFALAGQGAALARAVPAGDLVDVLVAETEAAIGRLAGVHSL